MHALRSLLRRLAPLSVVGRGAALAALIVATAMAAGGVAADAPVTGESLLARVRAFDVRELPPHPRLLLADATVRRLRATLGTPEGAQQWHRLTEWLDGERARPLPDDPGPHVSYYTGPGGAIDIERFRRMQQLAEVVENHVVVAATAFRATGDARYLDLARRWTLAVAGWDPHGATGIQADDYAARQVLHALALAYDGLYAEWTPAERATIRGSMLARAAAIHAHLHPFKLDEYNNHPWFQCSALVDAGLALADESADADRWWRYGAELYFTRFLPLWGPDGDWHEGINYFTFTLKYVCQFANSLAGATGIDPFALPGLHRAGFFRLYGAPVGSIGIYFNDTRPLDKQNWDKPIAYRLAAVAGSPALEWYAEALPPIEDQRPSARLYELLYRDPALRAAPPGPELPLARYFEDSGWVITRGSLATGRDIEFGFKSSPWRATPLRQKGHDHPDANNFLLNFLGQPLLVDSGFYDYYNSPHHRDWTFSGRAHNTLLIDGQGQQQKQPGRIVAFHAEPGAFDWMEGEGAAAYAPGLLRGWRRQVLHLRPDLFIVRDVVRPARPAVITWLLHGAQPFDLRGQAFASRNGEAAVAGEVALPRDLAVRQWTGFPADAMPERKTPEQRRLFPDQSHLEFSTPGKVGDTTFIAVFRPGRAGELEPVEVAVQSRDGTDTVTIAADAGPPLRVVFPPAADDDQPSPRPEIRR